MLPRTTHSLQRVPKILARRSLLFDSRRAASNGVGVGGKHPIPADSDSAVAKRAHFAKETIASVQEKLASVMGKTTETFQGNGIDGKRSIPPEPIFGSRSITEEEILKGRAAGGTHRDH